MLRNPWVRAAAWRSCAEHVGIALLLLAVIILLQRRVDAYSAEFGTDEASHYVSGLMIHAYLTTGLAAGPLSPIAFLRSFHSHYPLVGIGHWGPFYYFIEAVWMLLFGSGRASVLLLSAVVTTAIGSICYAVVARRCGRVAAGLIALALVASPIVQEGSAEVMLDAPIALFALLAALSYARYMAECRARDAIWFALFASAGLLIKGNAACLALLPPLAVLIGRRFDLLRRPSFWLPLPIVGCIAVPWYLFTYPLVSQGFRYSWGLAYVVVATRENATALLHATGPILLAAGLFGCVAVVWSAHRRQADYVMTCTASLLVATWVFVSVVPAAIQDRYLEPAIPPLLILAGAALRFVVDWSQSRLPVRVGPLRALAIPLLAVVLAGSIVPAAADMEPKAELGFTHAAQQVWQQVNARNPVVLVVARQIAESSAVAELALHDPHCPSLFAVRGSRLLGGGGYNNQDYRPRFTTPEQVMAAIDEFRIPLVLFRSDGGADEWAHVRQIAEAIRLYPNRWEVVDRIEAPGAPVLVLRVRGNTEQPADLRRLAELTAPRSLAGLQ